MGRLPEHCSDDNLSMMRAEIININNGTLQGNKITMVRGDTLEITLRVLRDDDSAVLVNRFEAGDHEIANSRIPSGSFNHRLSIEFMATLKDGGEIRLIYRTTQSSLHIIYGSTDELTVVIDQHATKRLPAPLSLNFDMQVTEFVDERYRRTSTVYQGILQVEKDYTAQY